MKTILVTDDNATCGTLIQAVLQEQGYDVFYLPRKDKTIELISTLQTDLLITDLSHAPIDGYELIHSVVTYNPKIPIVVVSGRMDQAIEQKARRLGASFCCEKPFGIEKLLTGVEHLLHRHRSGPAAAWSAFNKQLLQNPDLPRKGDTGNRPSRGT